MFYAVWFNMLKSDEYTETHLVPIVFQYGWVRFKESYMKRSLDSDLEKRAGDSFLWQLEPNVSNGNI